ncbi:hypothetical protein [Ciceribacter selenitireducens]|nr:hypothetical protein [Ciceribacter selenitireducens]
MTLDTVAKFSAAYILTIIVSAGGYMLWEERHPRTSGAPAEFMMADR